MDKRFLDQRRELERTAAREGWRLASPEPERTGAGHVRWWLEGPDGERCFVLLPHSSRNEGRAMQKIGMHVRRSIRHIRGER